MLSRGAHCALAKEDGINLGESALNLGSYLQNL